MDILYFYADDGVNGRGLFSFDGTDLQRLVDVTDNSPDWAVLGDRFFSIGNGVGGGSDFFSTDGTPGGTVSILGAGSGFTASLDQSITASGGQLFLHGTDVSLTPEIYVGDGTTAGTSLLAIPALSDGGFSQFPVDSRLVPFNGGVLFNITEFVSSGFSRTYFTDGTAASIAPVTEDRAAFLELDLTRTAEFSGQLFVRGQGQSPTLGNIGLEPWVSDGTLGGTDAIGDFVPGPQALNPLDPVTVGNEVFFQTSDFTLGPQLWASDGTEAGTRMVRDFSANASGGAVPVLEYNGQLLFTGTDDVNGSELWISDGTTAGTQLVADINPGPGFSFPFRGPSGYNIDNFAEINGEVLFQATDGVNGFELWITNGTAAGTRMLADIFPGASGSEPANFVAFNDGVAFVANDGTNGREVWVTDGTTAGTQLLIDVAPGDGFSFPRLATAIGPNSVPTAFALSGNRVAESSPPGTFIGAFSATDADGDPLSFQLTNDAGGLFSLAGGNQLVVSLPLDFETAPSHQIGAEVSDGQGGVVAMNFTIDVVDVVEGPTKINGTLNDDPGLAGTAAAEMIDGLDGQDTVTYALTRAEVDEVVENDGSIIFTEIASGVADMLMNIERVVIDDGVYVYDLPGLDVPFTYRLYSAAFARTPDEPGLRFWNDQRNTGLDDHPLAQFFVDSPEFAQKFGANPTDGEFIDALYNNVLLRDADAAGRAFWLDAFATGAFDRADMLLFFSESPENMTRNEDNYDDGVWVI